MKDKPNIYLSDFDLGWLVGILEGEGCFTINNHPSRTNPQIQIYLSSTDEDIPSKVQKLTKIGKVTRLPNHYKRLGTKLVYRWTANARYEVIAILELIQPYMSARRSKRIQELLSLEYVSI